MSQQDETERLDTELWFTAEPQPDGQVRLRFSTESADPHTWDPLDFWIIPFDQVVTPQEMIELFDMVHK